MGEARKVIILFLLLLFIIIGLGVIFSRLSKNKKDQPILGGILDNIFFSKSIRVTPTPTPKGQTLITIKDESSTPTYGGGSGGQGGAQITQAPVPGSIPSTGTPTVLLVLAGAGLSSGILLRKFVR